ncbi:MAG: peptide deformylase [Bacteroidetes bacterium]|nr:MAG: peptide deformylase [Bacteroidota bacterium]
MKKLLFFTLTLLTLSACTSLRSVSEKGSPFSATQREMILSGDANTPMRVFLITNKQDSLLLRTHSQNVKADPKDPVLQLFIQRLYRTVTDSQSLGVGIAAPQVGILKNIIWVQRFDKPGFPFEAYLNPVIRQYSTKKQPCAEGCLSIPDTRGTTQIRAYAILLEYDRPDGSHQIEMVEDFTAVIFQHEIDHLNGILFIDHLQEEIRKAKGR